MKCDNVLQDLTTGGYLRRWRANRHLRRCATCRREQAALKQWQDELQREPLPPAHRQAWLAAAKRDPSPMRLRPPVLATRWTIALVGTAAVLLIAFVVGRPSDEKKQGIARQGEQPNRTAISGETAAKDINEIERGLQELSDELQTLRETIELLDERHRIERVSTEHQVHQIEE